MKLFICPACYDVVSCFYGKKFCRCTQSAGEYTDDLNAIFYGKAIPIGFNNTSFLFALKHRPKKGLGSRFEAFIIPEECPTCTYVEKVP